MTKWHVETNIGVVREENQDAAAVFSNSYATFALLCDGMGGHKGGRFASEATIKTFQKNFYKLRISKDPTTWFSNTLEKALKNMKAIPKKEKNRSLMDMWTTVVGALIIDNKVYVYNIGDSRCFYYNGIFHQVTIDQNLRNYLIHEENIPEEHANRVYGGNALTSSLGPKKKTELEIFEFELNDSSDSIILTSDGIHDFISKPTFESIIGSNTTTLKEKSTLAISKAVKGGSTDNLTIVIVKVNKDV